MNKLLLLLILSFPLLLSAQNGQTVPKRTHIATKLSTTAPKIDGRLNDAAWRTVVWSDSFIQINPIEKAMPSERTRFKVLYGAKNIYFAFICYDRHPQQIDAKLARRDDVDNSDFIAVGLDSYLDHRTGFVFGVNAAGVKMDMIFTNDGDNADDSWDPVWQAGAAVTDSGWVAEMAIPYSQLRFADKDEQVWGFQILRKIHRKQEEVMWQYIPKDAPGMISYFGELRGIRGIHMPFRAEIMPYGVFSRHTYPQETGNPFASGDDVTLNGGLDGKIGLTSDLTVDFTINPDFGQVEADPSEVNLSAYESFFEEKRPFFIEGKNIFSFPLAMGDGDFSSEQLFYSRRIGRQPHYYPDSEDGFDYNYADVPAQARILGAAKLSGKTQKGWSVGVLDAVTNKEFADLDLNGARSRASVEPLTNYFVSRLAKDFDEGNTSFGGMLTATNRKIEEEHLNFLNKSAYSGGIDLRHQWDHKTYFVSLKLAGSYLKGAPEALEQVQLSSSRYFQRPDADYVYFDSSRTSLAGHGGAFNIGRVGNSRWRVAAGALWRSPGFEINDLGYLRQADQIMDYIWVGYRINNPVGIFRSVNVNANMWQGWNFGGDRLFTGGNINGGVQFLNYWGVHLGINRQQAGQSTSMLRGGPMTRTLGSWNAFASAYSDSRNKWRVFANTSINKNDDHISSRINGSLNFSLKMGEQLEFNANPFYTKNIENLQYVTNEETANGDRYVFAKLKQHTLGIVFRVNYSPRPNLSIQYFGQPFTSSGKYSAFKRITNPRGRGAGRYELYDSDQLQYADEVYSVDENRDGTRDYSFDLPDFNWNQFLSNLVIRWEYRPGSTLYLVWSQNRDYFDSEANFQPDTNFGNLFRTTPNNTFLIKMNYWFPL